MLEICNICSEISKYSQTCTLWKESLNSDGHQFHQYQQNKQSPLILTELTEHKKIPQHDLVYLKAVQSYNAINRWLIYVISLSRWKSS